MTPLLSPSCRGVGVGPAFAPQVAPSLQVMSASAGSDTVVGVISSAASFAGDLLFGASHSLDPLARLLKLSRGSTPLLEVRSRAGVRHAAAMCGGAPKRGGPCAARRPLSDSPARAGFSFLQIAAPSRRRHPSLGLASLRSNPCTFAWTCPLHRLQVPVSSPAIAAEGVKVLGSAQSTGQATVTGALAVAGTAPARPPVFATVTLAGSGVYTCSSSPCNFVLPAGAAAGTTYVWRVHSNRHALTRTRDVQRTLLNAVGEGPVTEPPPSACIRVLSPTRAGAPLSSLCQQRRP
jgi:hypothetical protein